MIVFSPLVFEPLEFRIGCEDLFGGLAVAGSSLDIASCHIRDFAALYHFNSTETAYLASRSEIPQIAHCIHLPSGLLQDGYLLHMACDGLLQSIKAALICDLQHHSTGFAERIVMVSALAAFDAVVSAIQRLICQAALRTMFHSPTGRRYLLETYNS